MTGARLVRKQLRFERNFTQLPNAWMRDERLSYKARGLLAMLMTHEHGWNVTLKAIADATPKEGLDAMRDAAQELEAAGYLKRTSLARRRGRYTGDEWELCDPFEAVDNPLWTALAEPTRSITALAEPTRTALARPTPIRTPVEEEKELPSATIEALSTGRACATSPSGDHVFVGGRFCEQCGLDPRSGWRMDFNAGRAYPPVGEVAS